MESSAGDPTKAGKIRTEFFYDPFMAGDKAVHANRFYEILKSLPQMHYYLMNTGGIGGGQRYAKIRLEDTLSILDSLIRGGLEEWVDSPSGFQVPASMPAVDDSYFHPERLYSTDEFETQQKDLNKLRHETIEKVGGALHSKSQETSSRRTFSHRKPSHPFLWNAPQPSQTDPLSLITRAICPRRKRGGRSSASATPWNPSFTKRDWGLRNGFCDLLFWIPASAGMTGWKHQGRAEGRSPSASFLSPKSGGKGVEKASVPTLHTATKSQGRRGPCIPVL